jgi:hypothetical protein
MMNRDENVGYAAGGFDMFLISLELNRELVA